MSENSGSPVASHGFGKVVLALIATLISTLPLLGADDPSIALFSRSIDPEIDDSRVRQIENLVSASLSKRGFKVMQSDILIEPAKNWASSSKIEGGYSGFLNALEDTLTATLNAVKEKPDDPRESLLGDSSIANLSQTFGADFLLVLTVDSYSHETRDFKGNSLLPKAFTNHFHRLAMSYRLVSGSEAISGDSVMEEVSWRESKSFSRDTDSIIDELMLSSAKKIAEKVASEKSKLSSLTTSSQSLDLTLRANVTLPGGADLQLPTLVNNRVELTTAKLNGEVHVDGILAGNLNQKINIGAGLHQVSVTIPGYASWSRFVNVKESMELDIQMEMTAEAYKKWRATVEELQAIGRKTTLTDAEMETLEAKAEALKDADIEYNISLSEDI
jgi:hypothetical protein